jgi:hypothetical protein
MIQWEDHFQARKWEALKEYISIASLTLEALGIDILNL